jgi:hypothetical protein
MADNGTIQVTRKPRGRLIAVSLLMCLQVAGNILLGLLMLWTIEDDESHGIETENAGLLEFIGYASFMVAAVLLLCVVMLLASRYAWPRYTAIALEVLAAASTLIPLFAGAGPGSLLGAIIPLLLVRELSHEDVAAWCNK